MRGDDAIAVSPLSVDASVARAAAGDREAFGVLYRRHYGAIYRYCRLRLGGDGEDAASEVFVRAWAALPRYKKTDVPFLAWLYGIARHIVTDVLRTRGRTVAVAEPSGGARDFDTAATIDLMQAISELPRDQRRVIEMKYLLGMRNPEVAFAMSKGVGAVNAQQWRALGSLREKLGS